MRDLYIGTSGWVYKGWAGAFYPPRLSPRKKFDFYASQFPTVEINNTFYRLPTENAVRGWHEQAPPGFIYAVKGSRFVTQMKKLNVGPENLSLVLDRIVPLKQHLGPVLWQLPPNFGINVERLARFLDLLPKRFEHVMEFRHPSWLDRKVFALLDKHKVACASVSSLRMPMDFTVTGEFVYLRFHGLEGGFAHDYTRQELQPWADHCRAALRHGLRVFAYFNNDMNTRAPDNAKVFIEMIADARKPRPVKSVKGPRMILQPA